MPSEDEMTMTERRKDLKRMKPLDEKAKKSERGQVLDQMPAVTGFHRKRVLRLFHASSLEHQPQQKQRQRRSGPEVERVIIVVWERLDSMCAERLTPVLLSMALHLQRGGLLHVSASLQEHVSSISRATVVRLVRKHRSQQRRLPRKGPERAKQRKREVPMKRMPWDTSEPGQCEVDRVSPCGERTLGEHLHTLQRMDVATGWSERVAVSGRGQQAMEQAFRHILTRLPFAVKERHPEHGPEFFNAHLVRVWKEKVVGVHLSRSRPSHKHDNRFGEQKNESRVRQSVGTRRLDTAEQGRLMNEIAALMWLSSHLFQPVLHLVEKTVVEGNVHRRWDQAQTPSARLKATGFLNRHLSVTVSFELTRMGRMHFRALDSTRSASSAMRGMGKDTRTRWLLKMCNEG